ncbi:MAG: T9SS type A sorting domain-containing protein, partial [Bacteroidales bacterium]|nr:T9SS type A sorting domain-containing protein [Bacteroidales bacterium]
VIIPNSISSLNANAVFTYCTRLTSIINMNTIPQAITTLGNSATFYDVPNNVNVYVPCSSLSAYQNSSWGNKFNNIKGFSSDTIISAHINIGNTYTLNGFNVDSTGLYINAIQNSFGCYDLKILNLHVDMNRILNVTICEGDCFTINGVSYNQPGNYIIDSFTINNNICKTILNLSINSSINEVNNDNISVLVYPNPTNNKATLDIEGLNEKATLFIYDLQGREMMRKELNVGEKDIELNVKGFSKGVYNVRIVNNKDNITKKLIIQ